MELVPKMSETNLTQLVVKADSEFRRILQGKTLSTFGKNMVLKMSYMLSYMISDKEQVKQDLKEIYNALLSKDDILNGEKDALSELFHGMNTMVLKTQLLTKEKDTTLALASLHTQVARATHGAAQEQTEFVREERKSWVRQEAVGVALSSALAGGTVVGTHYITGVYDYAQAGVQLASHWLSNPLGYCDKVVTSVVEPGWLYGESNVQKSLRPTNFACQTLDSLAGGLTEFANVADRLKSGTLILIFIVAFVFIYVIYKILLKKRFSVGLTGGSMGFNRKSKRKTRKQRK